MSNIKVYCAHRMTGRMCDELVQEAELTTRALTNHGFIALDPITEEKVQPVHEVLAAGTVGPHVLEQYWKRDKEMLREADIMLDYLSNNMSDGVGKELGYARFCLWKPTVRVVGKPGFAISRLEDDIVVDSLSEALEVMKERFGTYEKLGQWRKEMWNRSYQKWWLEQIRIHERYGLERSLWEVV